MWVKIVTDFLKILLSKHSLSQNEYYFNLVPPVMYSRFCKKTFKDMFLLVSSRHICAPCCLPTKLCKFGQNILPNISHV